MSPIEMPAEGAGASEHHIVLLPREDYWAWVRAVGPYVLKFGPNITPNPDTAGTFSPANLIVTIVDLPNGYPEQGNIKDYFIENYPAVRLDIIAASTPGLLAPILQERIDNNKRYGDLPPVAGPDAPFRLFWPTDYPQINQYFGDNPELYNPFGLPGHEGLDVRAPFDTNVYACADGEVYQTHHNPDDHPYGRHVRLLHRDGYKTVYAHLASIEVSEGEIVRAKQKIGLADSTGNSTGSHVHLTLKKSGATKDGLTHYPSDIIDPTPYMVYPGQEDLPPPNAYPWPLGRCLVGLNARDDGSYHELDFKVVEQARLEAYKVEDNSSAQDIERLRQINPAIFLIGRAHYAMGQAKVGPEEWVGNMEANIRKLYDLDVRFFEVHRSPNLQLEGWGHSWFSGEDFSRWWLEVFNRLRDLFPEGQFGFPGLSPGGQVEGQRFDARTFIEQADEAILSADWAGVNCYWISEQEMYQEEKGLFYSYMRRRFPEKLLFVTEFANVNELTNHDVKGREYVRYLERLRLQPGIGAAFANVASSKTGYGKTRWRREDGVITKVVAEVAKRNF